MPKGRDVQRVPKEDYRVVTNAEASRRIAEEMEAVLNERLGGPAHGIECLEYKVVVRPVKAADKTSGGIHLPDVVVEKDQHAAMEGELVGMSPLAFSYEDNAPCPEIGDRVLFQRYSGLIQRGADGVEYRIMNDKDVVAVLRGGR